DHAGVVRHVELDPARRTVGDVLGIDPGDIVLGAQHVEGLLALDPVLPDTDPMLGFGGDRAHRAPALGIDRQLAQVDAVAVDRGLQTDRSAGQHEQRRDEGRVADPPPVHGAPSAGSVSRTARLSDQTTSRNNSRPGMSRSVPMSVWACPAARFGLPSVTRPRTATRPMFTRMATGAASMSSAIRCHQRRHPRMPVAPASAKNATSIRIPEQASATLSGRTEPEPVITYSMF